MTTGVVKGLDVISDWSIVKTDLTTSGNPEQLFTLVNRIPFFFNAFAFFTAFQNFSYIMSSARLVPKRKTKVPRKLIRNEEIKTQQHNVYGYAAMLLIY